jgi:hypothetical protein
MPLETNLEKTGDVTRFFRIMDITYLVHNLYLTYKYLCEHLITTGKFSFLGFIDVYMYQTKVEYNQLLYAGLLLNAFLLLV